MSDYSSMLFEIIYYILDSIEFFVSYLTKEFFITINLLSITAPFMIILGLINDSNSITKYIKALSVFLLCVLVYILLYWLIGFPAWISWFVPLFR